MILLAGIYYPEGCIVNFSVNQSMITTVIFDLDDTLYDELQYCKSGFRAVAESLVEKKGASFDAERIFETLNEQFRSGDRTKIFNAALERLNIGYDRQLIAELVRVYRNHRPQINLPQDAGTTLEKLSKDYRLAMLTDGFMPAQRLKVEALKIARYFECIIYTEELGREYWKPSQTGFKRLLEKMQITADSAAYIADNVEKDFIAPNSLRMMTVQIIRAERIRPASVPCKPEAAPRHIIKTLTQLTELLGSA